MFIIVPEAFSAQSYRNMVVELRNNLLTTGCASSTRTEPAASHLLVMGSADIWYDGVLYFILYRNYCANSELDISVNGFEGSTFAAWLEARLPC